MADRTSLTVTARAARAVRIWAATGTAGTGSRVTQSQAIAAADAVIEAHTDEFIAAIGTNSATTASR